MKRKFLSILLVLSVALTLLPTAVLADEGATGGGEAVPTGEYVATVYEAGNNTAIGSYTSLTAAAQAAAGCNTTTGKTIKLLNDITEDVPSIGGLNTIMLTIDLNGHNYTGTIEKYHDLTVINTSTEKTGKAHFNYVMCNVLHLNGGNVVIDDALIFHATYLDGATVTINGGEYQLGGDPGAHTQAVTVKSGSLTINSGCFDTSDNLENGGNSIIPYTTTRYTAGETITHKCYAVGRAERGAYTVKKTSSDNSSPLYFYDLSTAALVAADGDTIELLGNQTISKKVEIKASVTLDGGGNKVKLAETVKGINLGNYAHGAFVISGDGKTSAIRNAKFEDIEYNTVLIRPNGANSTFTVDNCTFDNVKVINVVRAASSTAANCKLVVTNSVFKNCTASLNGIIQIDSSSNNTASEIKNNSFISNSIGPANNVAVIYLSAPATVQNNYFEGNTTGANDNTKNGIIVTGSNAGGSAIEKNAFVSHTFTNGDEQGAVYGAKVGTTVATNYYADGITHLAKTGEGFTEGTAAKCYAKKNAGVVVNADHTWDEGVVTTEPTYTEAGVKTYTCTVCHETYTAEIPMLTPSSDSSSSSGSSSYDPTYSVSTPSKTEHGAVTVSPKSASKGDRVTVTVKPDSGYVLETLTVTDKNGNELTLKDKGNGKYTFTMPAGKVEVKATFMEDNSMLNFFYDVPNNAYFYEAVKWAVENGITTGVGNDLFAPEQPCTRAQIVTFLWRAAGSPEPKGAASGMSDVVSGSYYEKAVAWAIENGITTGTTTSTFSPDVTCTRAQAVTFLARALKAKAASAAEFSDVPTDSYFADAVAWAAANGVTEGIGGGLFGSDNDCTRGQIVTFLYRAYNK